MVDFWTGFEKRASMTQAAEGLASKAVHTLDYKKINAVARKAESAASPTLNYAAMKAPVSNVPKWKSTVPAKPKMVVPNRTGWTSGMVDRIKSGTAPRV